MRPNQCMRALASCLLAAAMSTSVIGPADAEEPPVPPGLSPSGVAVALLGPGIDYRGLEISRRLARDGEGDLIGWDFTDNDTRPFADNGPGTRWVRLLLLQSPSVVAVVVKEAPEDPHALGRMIQFTLRTPAKIIVWPGASPKRPDWPILAEAIQRFPDRLFIIPAYNIGTKLAQIGSVAANLIIVDHETSQRTGLPRVADVVAMYPPGKKDPGAPKSPPDAAVRVAGQCAEALAADSALTPAALKKMVVGLKMRYLAKPRSH